MHFNDYKDNGLNLEFKYHDHDEMTKYLRATSARFPNLTALYSIGKSVQGDERFYFDAFEIKYYFINATR